MTPSAGPEWSPEPAPIVSVILRTRDRLPFLAEALESLRGQTFTDFETILVNDGGTPPPKDLLASPAGRDLRLLNTEPPHGRSRALNTGVHASRGRYIAYLDDDDLYRPDHLATLVGYLDRPESLGAAYTDVEQIEHVLEESGNYRNGRRITVYARDFDHSRLLYANTIPLIGLMHQKTLGEAAGLYDESFDLYEDWDFLIRLSRVTFLQRLPTVTAIYRVRNDRTNASRADPWRGERSLAARRQLFEKHRGLRTFETEVALLDSFENDQDALRREIGSLSFEVGSLREEGERRRQEDLRREADLTVERASREARVRELQATVDDLRAQLVEAETLEAAMADRQRALHAEKDRLATTLDAVQASLTWRMMTPYWKLRECLKKGS